MEFISTKASAFSISSVMASAFFLSLTEALLRCVVNSAANRAGNEQVACVT